MGSGERVDAVLLGTLAQFEQLLSTLDWEDGLETVAREIGETLGLESAAMALE
ncbi:hypothetical protein [Serratia marcescens]|uniref:hypothetical protein n=1 Tax=Serratia marcescens TaxID=615 RepID=UPI0013DB1686|nr:hypothetical protein [Serratia marcescens]